MLEGQALIKQQGPAEEGEEAGGGGGGGLCLRARKVIEETAKIKYEAGCPGKPIDLDPDRC